MSDAPTLPPAPSERQGAEAFEALIKEKGEAQARIRNLQTEEKERKPHETIQEP